jgi:Ca2+/H+ antiporter
VPTAVVSGVFFLGGWADCRQSIFLTVLLVKFVIEDGRTHWLNGVTLVCVYVMLATTFWHFPTR